MADLIERQAAIDAICENCEYYKNEMVIDAIHKLPSAQPETCEYWDDESSYCALYRPSAQPERKKGKWIKVGDNSYKCSVCNEISCCMGNYCPDCGADMRGEEDE